MIADAASPTLSASSSTASLVIDAVITAPPAISIRTCDVVAPRLTSTTLPARTLRAESFMASR